jgi:hypothetical protein
MTVGAILIEGTAIEQEIVNERENKNRIQRTTVEREIDIDIRIELKNGNPNVDFYRSPDSVHEEVENSLNSNEGKLYHSVEIDRVYLNIYDIDEQAKVFASERSELTVQDAKEKMLRWSNMNDIRYGK